MPEVDARLFTCPTLGCDQIVPRSQLVCWRCWAYVPVILRRRFLDAHDAAAVCAKADLQGRMRHLARAARQAEKN